MAPFLNYIWKLTQRDFWWAEFFSSIALILWACVNILSPKALSTQNFWPLLQVAPDIFWEHSALAAGSFQLLALVADSKAARAAAAFLSTWLVGAMTTNMLMLAHWPPGSIGFYFSSLCTNMMALWKNIAKPEDKK